MRLIILISLCSLLLNGCAEQPLFTRNDAPYEYESNYSYDAVHDPTSIFKDDWIITPGQSFTVTTSSGMSGTYVAMMRVDGKTIIRTPFKVRIVPQNTHGSDWMDEYGNVH